MRPGARISRAGWLALVGLFACDASDSSGTVTVRMPKAPSAIVAYRDGDGPWTTTTGAAGSVRFAAPSGTYTVVVGCLFGQEGQASVYAMTTAEISTIDFPGECGGETQVISGQLAGFGGTAFVYWGQRTVALGGSSFTLEAPRGTGDLLAIAGARVAMMRDVSLGASPVSLNVDFNAPSAADLVQRRVTLSSIDESQTNAYGALWTQGGTYASLCSSNGATACGLPSAALAAGDLHMIKIESAGSGPYRAARWAVHDVTDREIIFPLTTLSEPQVAITNQQTKVAVSVSWPDAPSAPLYRVFASQYSGPPPYRFWQIVASERFVAGGLNLSLPDLGGVTGWEPGLELVPGGYVEWNVTAETGATLDELLRWYPAHDGTIFENGFRGSVTPQ